MKNIQIYVTLLSSLMLILLWMGIGCNNDLSDWLDDVYNIEIANSSLLTTNTSNQDADGLEIVSIDPPNDGLLKENGSIEIIFNQPIDIDSLEIQGTLCATDGEVCTSDKYDTTYNADEKRLTIKPITEWLQGAPVTFTLSISNLDSSYSITENFTFYVRGIYVDDDGDRTSCNGIGYGTKECPFSTIPEALDFISTLDPPVGTVKIAGGLYTITEEPILLTSGIGISGGWDATFSTQNFIETPDETSHTVILDTRKVNQCDHPTTYDKEYCSIIDVGEDTVESPAETMIEGLHLKFYEYGIRCHSLSTPIIENNVIEPRTTSDQDPEGTSMDSASYRESYGILILNAGPTISNNTMYGGNSTHCHGIGIYHIDELGTEVPGITKIHKNYIYGSKLKEENALHLPEGDLYGILLGGVLGAVNIDSNYINAGYGTGDSDFSYGIYATDCEGSITISDNKDSGDESWGIYGGSNHSAFGLQAKQCAGDIRLTSNHIYGEGNLIGGAIEVFGVYHELCANVEIKEGNTITVGNLDRSLIPGDYSSTGLYNGFGSTVTIEDLIIDAGSGSSKGDYKFTGIDNVRFPYPWLSNAPDPVEILSLDGSASDDGVTINAGTLTSVEGGITIVGMNNYNTDMDITLSDFTLEIEKLVSQDTVHAIGIVNNQADPEIDGASISIKSIEVATIDHTTFIAGIYASGEDTVGDIINTNISIGDATLPSQIHSKSEIYGIYYAPDSNVLSYNPLLSNNTITIDNIEIKNSLTGYGIYTQNLANASWIGGDADEKENIITFGTLIHSLDRGMIQLYGIFSDNSGQNIGYNKINFHTDSNTVTTTSGASSDIGDYYSYPLYCSGCIIPTIINENKFQLGTVSSASDVYFQGITINQYESFVEYHDTLTVPTDSSIPSDTLYSDILAGLPISNFASGEIELVLELYFDGQRMIYGTDFSVAGNDLTWLGTASTDIVTGDSLDLFYYEYVPCSSYDSLDLTSNKFSLSTVSVDSDGDGEGTYNGIGIYSTNQAVSSEVSGNIFNLHSDVSESATIPNQFLFTGLKPAFFNQSTWSNNQFIFGDLIIDQRLSVYGVYSLRASPSIESGTIDFQKPLTIPTGDEGISSPDYILHGVYCDTLSSCNTIHNFNVSTNTVDVSESYMFKGIYVMDGAPDISGNTFTLGAVNTDIGYTFYGIHSTGGNPTIHNTNIFTTGLVTSTGNDELPYSPDYSFYGLLSTGSSEISTINGVELTVGDVDVAGSYYFRGISAVLSDDASDPLTVDDNVISVGTVDTASDINFIGLNFENMAAPSSCSNNEIIMGNQTINTDISIDTSGSFSGDYFYRGICVKDSSPTLEIHNNIFDLTGVTIQSDADTDHVLKKDVYISAGIEVVASNIKIYDNNHLVGVDDYCIRSMPMTINNVPGISGSEPSHAYSYGIAMDGDASTYSCIAYNNFIEPGSINRTDDEGDVYIYGISTVNEGGGVFLNNVIKNPSNTGGFNGTTFGIYASTTNTNVTVCNNTIYAGAISAATNDNIAYGLYTTQATNLTIDNTILITGSAANGRYGIYEGDNNAGTDPDRVKNNVVFDCPTALYYDQDGTTKALNFIDGNGNFSNGLLVTLLTPVAEDNVSVDPNLDTTLLFLNALSPVQVYEGGSDKTSIFSSNSIPIGDIQKNARTIPWSIGAFEFD